MSQWRYLTCWSLLESNSYTPLGESQDDEPSSSPSKVSLTNGEWLSQVEILTHAPPSRRLWMGPQFSFKSYHSNTTSSSAANSSNPAVLKTPSPPNTVIYTGSLVSPSDSHSSRTQMSKMSSGQKLQKMEAESDEQKITSPHFESDEFEPQGATLFPSSEIPLVDFLSEPTEFQSLALNSIGTSSLGMPTGSKQEGTEAGNRDPGQSVTVCLPFIVHFL